MPHRHFSLAALAATALTLAACGDGRPTPAPTAAAPAAWQLETAPEGALDIVAAKTTAKEGDVIAIRGKIGGRLNPLSPESGLLVLMDHAIPSCADNPKDGCTTPWDYCCETPQLISANAATVQLRGADGQAVVLPQGAFSGLDEVVVVGTVAPRPNDQTLVLHATGVHVAAAAKPAGHAGGEGDDHHGHDH